jgi:hypothetical protein
MGKVATADEHTTQGSGLTKLLNLKTYFGSFLVDFLVVKVLY